MIKIAILGVGLIGGSLALSLKKLDETYIVGFDVSEDELRLAQSLGVIDQGTTHLAEAVVDADFIFLCAPVGKLFELLAFLRYTPLKKGAIISDTGSTKETILKFSYGLMEKGVYFIGGHPMAGSHKSGVIAATDRLFENAYYVLTPDDHVPDAAIEKLKHILKPTKAHIIVMNAKEHDRVVAAISHFPHIIASTLVTQIARYESDEDWYRRLAAGGFRDLTRIASSNPIMWRDILLNNREAIIAIAEDWKKVLDDVIELVKEAKAEQIEQFFRDAREFRDNLPERKRGALPTVFDLYVDIPDYPGVIGKVTTLLGENEISITNIQILETREDIMGVLRISFRNEEDQEHAYQLLTNKGYSVYGKE